MWRRRNSPHLLCPQSSSSVICLSPPGSLSSMATDRKWTVYKLKALNRCALRETSYKVSGRRQLSGLPQASSTLLHAVFSTPQCSEQAIPRMGPEWGGQIGGKRVRAVSQGKWGGGVWHAKAVKAMMINKKARVCFKWISLENKWKQFTNFITSWSQWDKWRGGCHRGEDGLRQIGMNTRGWAVVNSRYQVRTGFYQTFNAERIWLLLQQGEKRRCKVSSESTDW